MIEQSLGITVNTPLFLHGPQILWVCYPNHKQVSYDQPLIGTDDKLSIILDRHFRNTITKNANDDWHANKGEELHKGHSRSPPKTACAR